MVGVQQEGGVGPAVVGQLVTAQGGIKEGKGGATNLSARGATGAASEMGGTTTGGKDAFDECQEINAKVIIDHK